MLTPFVRGAFRRHELLASRAGVFTFPGLVLLAGALASGCGGPSRGAASADATNPDEPAARLADAGDVLADVIGDKSEHRIPERLTKNAQCVAVVPGLTHGALIVGARYGRGVATCRTDDGWSLPAFFTVTGGTAGFEVGVQSVDLVMLVLSDQGRRVFTSDDGLRLGGDVSATAGPEGRGRAEDTDTSLRSAIVSYSHSRGLFAGVDLSGVVVRADPNAAAAFYGHDASPATLLARKAESPSHADGFLSRVRSEF